MSRLCRFGMKRRFSSIEESSDLVSIRRLIQKSLEPQKKLQPCAVTAFKNREWTSANIIEASSKMPWMQQGKYSYSIDPIVRVRWIGFEDRNIDIKLKSTDNRYTADVKSVLYSIITAIQYNEKSIKIQTSNEVIMKIGNGVFKSKIETLRLSIIQKFVENNSKKSWNHLKVKLEKIDSLQKEGDLKALQIDEAEFFEKFKTGVDKLKEVC